VVWPNIVAETSEKTHANSVADERFVMVTLGTDTEYCPKEADEAMAQTLLLYLLLSASSADKVFIRR
jgi:hypothetical protein